MCVAFTQNVYDGDLHAERDLLLLADDQKVPFTESEEVGRNFHDVYEAFCKSRKMPFDEADLTYESLARYGIVKFWDAHFDCMCVAGFAILVKPALYFHDKKDRMVDTPEMLALGYPRFAAMSSKERKRRLHVLHPMHPNNLDAKKLKRVRDLL